MALTVGELVGYLRIDDKDWTRKLRKAGDDLDRVGSGFVQFGDTATRTLAQVALAMSALSSGATTVGGAAAVISTATGALGVLPAMGVAVGAGMAAAKVGMSGFGDAMDNLGDPEKFAEALAELSPAAQESARAVQGLTDEWDALTDSVQDRLFGDLAGDITALGGRYLPLVEDGLTGIAGSYNRAAKEAAGWLADSRQVDTVSTMFGDVGDAIDESANALQPLLSILLDVAAVGSEFLPGMAAGFAESAQRAADFVSAARESGELHDWISAGLSELGDLADLFGNLGRIVGSVFGALDSSGAGFLTTLVDLTGQAADFLESLEGQAALTALGEAFATVGAVVSEVVLVALQQLAPIIVQLAPAFATLAQQAGGILVPALQTLGPILAWIAEVIADNIEWLAPLTLGLLGAAKAFGVVTTAVQVLGAISKANPWVVIISATIALATIIVTHWDEITAAVGAAWDWLVARAGEVWGWIERNIIDHITAAAEWVGDRISDIITFFGWLGSLPGRVANWFGQAKDWAVRKLGELVSWMRGLPGRILNALGNFGSLLVNAGRDLVNGLIRGIGNMAGAIWDALVGIVSDAWNGALDFLGIASPSKEGIWAGQMIGDGLVRGLMASRRSVSAAAGELAASAAVQPAAVGVDDPFAGSAAAGGLADVGGVGGRALVHIEHYQPPADASADEVAERLDWYARGGG